MYATGIGLVLYGIEKSEQENEDDDIIWDDSQVPEPAAEKNAGKKEDKNNGHVDIFGNMGDLVPATETKTEPDSQPESKVKDKKDKEKRTFNRRLNQFFGKVFGENGIDD